MRGCSGCLGFAGGCFLAMIFLVVTSSAVWFFNINRTLFSAETYATAFEDENLYQEFPSVVLRGLAIDVEVASDSDASNTVNFQDIADNLDESDWDSIAQQILPPEYLQEQVERNLPLFVDYLNAETTALDIRFDTALIIENLLGPPGEQMVNRIIISWDDCTPEEEEALASYFADEDGTFPYCRPANAALESQMFTLLGETKDGLAEDIQREAPEQWSLRETIAEEENMSLEEVDRELFIAIQQPAIAFRNMVPLIFLIPSAFLAMIVIVSVRSTPGFFRWMGWPIAITGLATLLPLLAFTPVLVDILTADSELSANAERAYRELVRSLILSLSTPILVQGAAMVIGGFFMVLLSILLPEPQEPMPNVPAQQPVKRDESFSTHG